MSTVTIGYTLAGLIAVGIVFIGGRFLVAPRVAAAGYGVQADPDQEAVGAYLLTYVVTSIGAFGVVTLTSNAGDERDADVIYDYRGMFWRRPYLASILTAMLLSLAGIPLTAGFIGKFYIIAAGLDGHQWWLLGAVVVGSAIGLYYYLRLLISLFLLDPSKHRFAASLDWAQRAGGIMVLLAMVLMLLLGVFPQPFIHLLQASTLLPH